MLTNERIIAFSDYLRREEKSETTQEKYLRDIKDFYKFTKGQIITKELVIQLKKSLIDRGYAVRSVNSMIAGVNGFLDFLGKPMCKVKSVRAQRQTYCTADKELTKSEYLKLLEASKNKRQLNLIIQTICGTGIRVSELRFFTVEAVSGGEVTVDCKNKTRTVIIPEKLKKMLLSFAKLKGIKSGAIFVTRTGKTLNRSNIWTSMKRLCKSAGVSPSKVFPHNLRHLFARTFYGVEKDIVKLADKTRKG